MPYQQWQFRMGLHGLAILRIGTAATDEQLAEHFAALATPLAATEGALTKIIGGTERDVAAGYGGGHRCTTRRATRSSRTRSGGARDIRFMARAAARARRSVRDRPAQRTSRAWVTT